MRNSFKYSARQDWDAISRALKPVYQAAFLAEAEEWFLEFAEAGGGKYPAIVRLWENAWAEFLPFLGFDREIRRIVCTTNAISRSTPASARPSGPGATSPTSSSR